MDSVSTFTMLFQQYGAGFLVAILGSTVAYLFRIILQQQKERREDDRDNIRILERMQASVDALTKAVDRLSDQKPGG